MQSHILGHSQATDQSQYVPPKSRQAKCKMSVPKTKAPAVRKSERHNCGRDCKLSLPPFYLTDSQTLKRRERRRAEQTKANCHANAGKGHKRRAKKFRPQYEGVI